MRIPAVFLLGLLLGSVVAPGRAQETRLAGMNGISHIAISVANFDEALAFYTQKMGFREAFTIRDEKGAPVLSNLHVNGTTFVELLPANANRRPGLDHFGVEADDTRAMTANLRQRGVTIEEPRIGFTKALITFAADPAGVRIELGEFGPESAQRKAVDSWKDNPRR